MNGEMNVEESEVEIVARGRAGRSLRSNGRGRAGWSLDETARRGRGRRASAPALELRIGGVLPIRRDRRQSPTLTGGLEREPSAVEAAGETDAREAVRQPLPSIGPATLLEHRWIDVRIIG